LAYALLGLAYLVGAVPTGYWVGRAFHGIDLRHEGSGNLGATNAFRVFGWRWALPVVLFDMAKGWIPVRIFPGLADVGFAWALAYGAAAIFGHMFSLWVGFRGGKGIATSAGVLVGLAPWAVLGAFAAWCLLTFPTGYVSVGSIGAALILPLLVALTPHEGGRGLTAFAAVLAVVVIWAHRANIRRLLRGEENRFGRRGSSGARPGPAPSDGPAHPRDAAARHPQGSRGQHPQDAQRHSSDA
jgi:glycerol-3-phosphate acyltransferase PlsY